MTEQFRNLERSGPLMGIVWRGLNSFHGLRDFFSKAKAFNAEHAEYAETS